MKPVVLAASRPGWALAERLASLLGVNCVDMSLSPAAAVESTFGGRRPLIAVGALGMWTRLIAPQLADKRSDPPVVVVDDAGRFAIPLVGGHAGANALAGRVAKAIGATPVITTASDALGLPAPDVLAAEHGWSVVATPEAQRRVAAAIVNGGDVAVYQDAGDTAWQESLPPHVLVVAAPPMPGQAAVAVFISDRLLAEPERWGDSAMVLRPCTLVAGIGASRGAPADEIDALLSRTLEEGGLAEMSLALIATADIKRDEPGLLEVARRRGIGVRYFSAADLAHVAVPTPSAVVAGHVDTPSVCEAAALLASGADWLVVAKHKSEHATVAIARMRDHAESNRAPGGQDGKLWVVGLGPGAEDLLTPRARAALEHSDAIVGYRVYTDMVRAWLPDAHYLESELGEERDRAIAALELAAQGSRVALISSGDAGVYGMAGLALELAARFDPAPAIEIVPGVTAAQAAAALCGAPLMTDYATLSLSDHLLPWDQIERRLIAATDAGFVLALYNPTSAARSARFGRALELLLERREQSTACAVVRDASRQGERCEIVSLANLAECEVDMRTILIIGNASTRVIGGQLVTPRGYKIDVHQVGQGQHV